MDVSWQDNVPSFLDASNPAAGGLAASLGDVGAPWFASADGGLFSGQQVLWWDNGADSESGASRLSSLASFDPSAAAGTDIAGTGGWIADGAETFSSASALQGGLLWADGGGSNSLFSDGGIQADGLGLGHGGTDASPSQWQQFVDAYAGRSQTWLNAASDLLWTGSTEQVPVTFAPVENAPLTSPTGLASLTAPFSMLAPQQLVWTDPSAGAAPMLSGAPYAPAAGFGPIVAAPYGPNQPADPAAGTRLLGFSQG